MNFPCEIETLPDGSKRLIVKCKAETIKRDDGTQDVIIHAPSLSTLAKTKEIGGK
jgi:hypothetical protein